MLALSDVLPNLVRYLLVEGETRAAHVDGVDVEELAILPDGHGDGVGGLSPTDEAGLGVSRRAVSSYHTHCVTPSLVVVQTTDGPGTLGP